MDNSQQNHLDNELTPEELELTAEELELVNGGFSGLSITIGNSFPMGIVNPTLAKLLKFKSINLPGNISQQGF
ncbi:MAG: hypothetical protein LDL41_15385 [Coleofasciculus sp. S288]|nr:hypothetical protein [Coleofasciculus sp. S288]